MLVNSITDLHPKRRKGWSVCVQTNTSKWSLKKKTKLAFLVAVSVCEESVVFVKKKQMLYFKCADKILGILNYN